MSQNNSIPRCRSGASTWASEFNHARGFSLLEVLVAFAILSLTLTVVMQVFSQVLGTTARVEAHRLALLLAESQLNAMVANDLESGHYQGEFDNGYFNKGHFDKGYRWRAVVEEMPPLDDEATDTPVWETGILFLSPHIIKLEISWGAGRQLTLQRLYLREIQ